MKLLIFAGLLNLINSAPNHNSNSNHNPNQSCNITNNGISRKTIRMSYNNKFCKCLNFRSYNHPIEDLYFPFAIFTSDASKYLTPDNETTTNGYTLKYQFNSEAKLNSYCRAFRESDWYCERGNNAVDDEYETHNSLDSNWEDNTVTNNHNNNSANTNNNANSNNTNNN